MSPQRPIFLILRSLWRLGRRIMPDSIRRRIEGSSSAILLRHSIGPGKYEAELGFWTDQFRESGGNLRNDEYYSGLVKTIGSFGTLPSFADKILVDIGCGPRGSLCWAAAARLRIGLDPLVDAYRQLNICRHPMHYVAARGEAMPLADASVDVVITINAMDHVEDAIHVMHEIRRILKPGGLFIGSIALREIPTATEPCIISREMVRDHLLHGWHVEHELVFPECDVTGDAYRYAHTPPPPGFRPEMQILWCKARKPS